MKRLLPLLALTAALAGCGFTASVTPADPAPVEPASPAGTGGEREMLRCRVGTDECARAGVVTDGATVERLRDGSGSWVLAAESECRDGRCVVKDENGTEWTLEP